MTDELLTKQQLAKILQVNPGTINNWVSMKKIKPEKFGGINRFRLLDVQRQLNKNS